MDDKKEVNTTNEMTFQKNKKSKWKLSIKTIIIIAVLIVAGVGGFFVYQKYEGTKTIGSKQGDIYYNYIKENKENTGKASSYNLNQKDGLEIDLVQSDANEYPIMYAIYTKDGNELMGLYEIDNNKEVNYIQGIGLDCCFAGDYNYSGDYYDGGITISNVTSNSLNFSLELMMSSSPYNLGKVERTAKSSDNGSYVYSEYQYYQYEGETSEDTFVSPTYSYTLTITLNNNKSRDYHCGQNVHFNGTYKK